MHRGPPRPGLSTQADGSSPGYLQAMGSHTAFLLRRCRLCLHPGPSLSQAPAALPLGFKVQHSSYLLDPSVSPSVGGSFLVLLRLACLPFFPPANRKQLQDLEGSCIPGGSHPCPSCAGRFRRMVSASTESPADCPPPAHAEIIPATD